MLRIVWDACSTVCRTASAKLSEGRPDSSMNFPTDIVPSLIVRAGYGLPETAGMQLGAGVVQGNEFRLTDLIGTLPIALRGAFPGRNNGISEQDRTTVAGPNLRSTSKSASDTLRHRGPLT